AHYASLNLTTNEAMFVLQLMTFKWDKDDPYPSYAAIARRMGVSEKMVRRYARALERKGLIRRKYYRRQTNRFDLSTLLEAIRKAPKRKREVGKVNWPIFMAAFLGSVGLEF